MGTRIGNTAAAFARGFRKGGPVQNMPKVGIFCGKEIGFGNNISHSHRRTSRTFKPNVHWKRFDSEILGEELRIKVTAFAIKCIEKNGGLDNFLITRPHLIRDSPFAQNLRQRILDTKEAKERAAILFHLGIKE